MAFRSWCGLRGRGRARGGDHREPPGADTLWYPARPVDEEAEVHALEPLGREAAGLEPAGLEQVGLEPLGLEPLGLEAVG